MYAVLAFATRCRHLLAQTRMPIKLLSTDLSVYQGVRPSLALARAVVRAGSVSSFAAPSCIISLCMFNLDVSKY
jgi:hypothetical protein